MAKKDTHNIPKDYEKSIKGSNGIKGGLSVTSSEAQALKQPLQPRLRVKLKGKGKLVALLAVCILVILAISYYYFFVQTNKNKEQASPVVSVELLSQEELNNLSNSKVDPKNIEASIRKAEALQLLDKQEEAAAIYAAIIEEGSGNYEITIKQALAVLATGDLKKSVELLNRAKDELNSSNVDDQIKQSQNRFIDNKIVEIKLEESTQ